MRSRSATIIHPTCSGSLTAADGSNPAGGNGSTTKVAPGSTDSHKETVLLANDDSEVVFGSNVGVIGLQLRRKGSTERQGEAIASINSPTFSLSAGSWLSRD